MALVSYGYFIKIDDHYWIGKAQFPFSMEISNYGNIHKRVYIFQPLSFADKSQMNSSFKINIKGMFIFQKKIEINKNLPFAFNNCIILFYFELFLENLSHNIELKIFARFFK